MPACSTRSAELCSSNIVLSSQTVRTVHMCGMLVHCTLYQWCRNTACVPVLSFICAGLSCRTLRTTIPPGLRAALPCACMPLTLTCTSGALCMLVAVSLFRSLRLCSATGTSWLLLVGHLCPASQTATCRQVQQQWQNKCAGDLRMHVHGPAQKSSFIPLLVEDHPNLGCCQRLTAQTVLQVCCLDLSSITSSRTPSFALGSARNRPTPVWMTVKPQGIIPSSRTASAAAVLNGQLVLHGGMLCSKSIAGRLVADTFCLDLTTWSWTRMAAAQERAVGSSSINVPRASHRAVAVPAAAAVMLMGECIQHMPSTDEDPAQHLMVQPCTNAASILHNCTL